MGGKKDDGGRAAAMASAAAEAEKARQALGAVQVSDYGKISDLLEQQSGEVSQIVGQLQAEGLNENEILQALKSPERAQALGVQQDTIRQLQEAVGKGGLTDADKARFRQLRQQVGGDEQARQAAIQQSMAERGMGGSGSELMAKLASSQASAQRASEGADRMAIAAAEAKQAGLGQLAQQSSQMRGQASQEAQNEAGIRQTLGQFSAMNRQNVNAQNLARQQSKADERASLLRDMYGKKASLEHTKFDEAYKKAGGQAAASTNMANLAASNYGSPNKGMGALGGAAAGAGIGAAFGPYGAGIGAGVGAIAGGTGMMSDGGVRRKYEDGSNLFALPGDREVNIPYSLDQQNPSAIPVQNIQQKPINPLMQKVKNNIDPEKGWENDYEEELSDITTEPNQIASLADLKRSEDANLKPEVKDLNPEVKKESWADKVDWQKASTGLSLLARGIKESRKGVTAPPPATLGTSFGQGESIKRREYADGGKCYGTGGYGDIEGAGGTSQELTGYDTSGEIGGAGSSSPGVTGGQVAAGMSALDMLLGDKSEPVVAPKAKLSSDFGQEEGITRDQYADGGIDDPEIKALQERVRARFTSGGYRKMAYEEGGQETEGRITPGSNYAGDELPDRINSGEMVLNVEQQDRLNDMLQELNRLRQTKRTDTMLEEGKCDVNPHQQDAMMAVLRGEADISALPKESIVKKEPSKMKNLVKLLGME